jgi:hypothetical protein
VELSSSKLKISQLKKKSKWALGLLENWQQCHAYLVQVRAK